MSKDLKAVSPLNKAKCVAIARCKKVVICSNACFSNEQPTSAHKLVVAVNPNIEVL